MEATKMQRVTTRERQKEDDKRPGDNRWLMALPLDRSWQKFLKREVREKNTVYMIISSNFNKDIFRPIWQSSGLETLELCQTDAEDISMVYTLHQSS